MIVPKGGSVAVLRMSKIVLVFVAAVLATLVSFFNILDYVSQFHWAGDTFTAAMAFLRNLISNRTITSPVSRHPAYMGLLALETGTAAVCWTGCVRLWARRREPGPVFQRAKATAVVGLTLAFFTWQVALMANGGEWFDTWICGIPKGVSGALPFVVTFVMVSALIHVTLQNDHRGPDAE